MPNTTLRANAQAMPIDRRVALGAIAAAGAMLAVPKIARADEMASPIALAYAEFQNAKAMWIRTCRAVDGACLHYEEPDLPAYDPRLGGGHAVETRADGTRRLRLSVSDENLAGLRAGVASHLARPDIDVGASVARQFEQVIGKIEAYRAERERRRSAAGLDVAESACDAAQNAMNAAGEAVFALAPGSLRDFAMQADVALSGDNDRLAQICENLIDFAGLARSSLEDA